MAGEAEDRARWMRSANALVGKVVGGKYRVEAILGRGGMGTIYVAEQQPLGRRVALKVLHPALGDGEADPEFQKRFLLEAATLSQLAHPNIVVVHDYGNLDDADGSCFMVMELLDGRTINQVLNEQGPFDPARALRITREIARALRAAHDLGVIHRDLKPANVMLCPSPEGESVKVLDFGLVKLLRDDSEELTAEGRFLGSPRYMSPEQIQRLPMDGRSDLYSLGVILYRMLTGEVPFVGDHAVQTLMGHLQKPVPPMASHGAQVPAAIDHLVMTLLEKEPQDRYADATALIRAIDAIWPDLSSEPLVASAEMSRPRGLLPDVADETPTTKSLPLVVAPPPPAGSAHRRPAWLVPLVVAIGVMAGLGGAAVVLLAGGQDADTGAVESGAVGVGRRGVGRRGVGRRGVGRRGVGRRVGPRGAARTGSARSSDSTEPADRRSPGRRAARAGADHVHADGRERAFGGDGAPRWRGAR